MNGKPFEELLSIRRSIMSGLKPLLEKMSAFCNHKSNSANNRWARLKANSDLLYTQIENAYGNEGKF